MDDAALRLWEDIGRHGFTVSIACGPCGAHPFRWTVTILAPHGEMFDRPYAAHSFSHAIDIALHEIERREWWRFSTAVVPR